VEAGSILRYHSYRFCKTCHKWIPRDYSYCPFCGNTDLREKPRTVRCRKHYNSKQYSVEDAFRVYERFLRRGYSREEASQFTEAITGISIASEPTSTQLTLDNFSESLIAVKVRSR
jgi:predicted amidophosphoribosyltransferase